MFHDPTSWRDQTTTIESPYGRIEVERRIKAVVIRVNGRRMDDWKKDREEVEEYVRAGTAVAGFLADLFMWVQRYADAALDLRLYWDEIVEERIRALRELFQAIARGIMELASSLPIDSTVPTREYPQATLIMAYEWRGRSLRRGKILRIGVRDYPVRNRSQRAAAAIAFLKRDAEIWQGDVGLRRLSEEDARFQSRYPLLHLYELADGINDSHVFDSACFRQGSTLIVPYPTRLLHREHAAVVLDPGVYRIVPFGGRGFGWGD